MQKTRQKENKFVLKFVSFKENLYKLNWHREFCLHSGSILCLKTFNAYSKKATYYTHTHLSYSILPCNIRAGFSPTDYLSCRGVKSISFSVPPFQVALACHSAWNICLPRHNAEPDHTFNPEGEEEHSDGDDMIFKWAFQSVTYDQNRTKHLDSSTYYDR